MNDKIELLDHGYLAHVEHWGSDRGIIEAARMSTNKGFEGWGPKEGCTKCGFVLTRNDNNSGKVAHTIGNYSCSHTWEAQGEGDERLLRYLYTHKHSTPFEMAGLTIEVKAPIFVFRQWHRHRTQSYNEMSARYTPLPDENYLPTSERCIVVPGKNKQARGANQRVPDHLEVLTWLAELQAAYDRCESVYQKGLALGIPKELARLPVPVARYTRMRASANLRNWLAFMTLRSDSHAQYEIRVFSDAIGTIIKTQFPRTYALWNEGMSK